jgi:hypothetical protein
MKVSNKLMGPHPVSTDVINVIIRNASLSIDAAIKRKRAKAYSERNAANRLRRAKWQAERRADQKAYLEGQTLQQLEESQITAFRQALQLDATSAAEEAEIDRIFAAEIDSMFNFSAFE